MTNDVEHLPIRVLICHALVKCLFTSFAHYFIGLCVLLLSFEGSSYILDINSLSATHIVVFSCDLWFVLSFSHSVF